MGAQAVMWAISQQHVAGPEHNSCRGCAHTTEHKAHSQPYWRIPSILDIPIPLHRCCWQELHHRTIPKKFDLASISPSSIWWLQRRPSKQSSTWQTCNNFKKSVLVSEWNIDIYLKLSILKHNSQKHPHESSLKTFYTNH